MATTLRDPSRTAVSGATTGLLPSSPASPAVSTSAELRRCSVRSRSIALELPDKGAIATKKPETVQPRRTLEPGRSRVRPTGTWAVNGRTRHVGGDPRTHQPPLRQSGTHSRSGFGPARGARACRRYKLRHQVLLSPRPDGVLQTDGAGGAISCRRTGRRGGGNRRLPPLCRRARPPLWPYRRER